MIQVSADNTILYDELLKQVNVLCDENNSVVSMMANVSSLLFWSVEKINWIGFYLNYEGMLILGPFHGKPACVCISSGKGACGTAAERKSTIIVDNVHEFPGHIACDSDSCSEIVIPILIDDVLVGVLDVDSPIYKRFGDKEKQFFESIVEILVEGWNSVRYKASFFPS